jgi:cobalt/nickel transport system permease protein/cobalt/nickel transport protein
MRRVIALLIMSLLLAGGAVSAENQEPKWPGVDETVVEKFARDLGREARDPYLNTDQGDLLLFLFALAGSVGGFTMGYLWHKVFVAGRDDRKQENDDRGPGA